MVLFYCPGYGVKLSYHYSTGRITGESETSRPGIKNYGGMTMEWLKNILEKAELTEDGKINIEKTMGEIQKEFPLHIS